MLLRFDEAFKELRFRSSIRDEEITLFWGLHTHEDVSITISPACHSRASPLQSCISFHPNQMTWKLHHVTSTITPPRLCFKEDAHWHRSTPSWKVKMRFERKSTANEEAQRVSDAMGNGSSRQHMVSRGTAYVLGVAVSTASPILMCGFSQFDVLFFAHNLATSGWDSEDNFKYRNTNYTHIRLPCNICHKNLLCLWTKTSHIKFIEKETHLQLSFLMANGSPASSFFTQRNDPCFCLYFILQCTQPRPLELFNNDTFFPSHLIDLSRWQDRL